MARAFKTQKHFRDWLERHHEAEKELVVRCFKVHARHRGIGYREALDEALCFGWIDGVRRALDADSFTQRFTPRKAKSNWSTVNIKRAKELESEGRMHAAGLEAFHARDKSKKAPYSFESRPKQFDPASEKRFRANTKAWRYFESCPPYYRRLMIFRVMEARKPETRVRRLDELIEWSAREQRMPLMSTKARKERLAQRHVSSPEGP